MHPHSSVSLEFGLLAQARSPATLTRSGHAMDDAQPIEFLLKETAPPPIKRRKKTPTVSTSRKPAPKGEVAEADKDARRETALRTWRLAEAKRRGFPAFRILSDRTLRALATSHPLTNEDLLDVPGIRTSTVAKYGTNICRVLRENGG